MRKISFINNRFYHIYNRGIEKRKIFIDDGDYLRFIHYFYELNDTEPLLNFTRYFVMKEEMKEAKPLSFPLPGEKKRKKLVDILCFCLMPNHFHLLLRQLVENGISQFMQKLGTAWAMFFNAKYERSGRLFHGVFKAVEVGRESQFLHLTRYQHLNPVDLVEPGWRKKGVKNLRKINKFLESYRWSSYLDYIDIKNFPSVINPEPLKAYFKSGDDYKKFVNEWLIKGMVEDVDKIGDIIIE